MLAGSASANDFVPADQPTTKLVRSAALDLTTSSPNNRSASGEIVTMEVRCRLPQYLCSL